MQSVDIAIIGGGMVGLAFAAALKDSDLRIAVIEARQPNEQLNELPDARVSALSRASEQFLYNLNAWQGIIQRRYSAYTGMEVWEKDSFARIQFDAQQIYQPNLGHIVENRIVQLALLDQVKQQDNLSLYLPAQVQQLVIGESEAWLTLADGKSLTAKLVVGADGAHSWLRQQQHIPLWQRDYGHTALVANIQTEEAHQQRARQIFTPQGPLAFLPMSQANMNSIVWSTEPSRAQQLLEMQPEQFNQVLTAEFDARLGRCQLIGERYLIPLTMRYARDFVAERIALIGDAAHSIHPLAGQGVNLGLMDAASLAQEIISLWQQGKDIGARRHLRAYERWRKTEATKMIAAMQGFKTLFDGDNPAKKWFRGVGLCVVEQLPSLKNEMMKQALGLTGQLPDLAQSQHK